MGVVAQNLNFNPLQEIKKKVLVTRISTIRAAVKCVSHELFVLIINSIQMYVHLEMNLHSKYCCLVITVQLQNSRSQKFFIFQPHC